MSSSIYIVLDNADPGFNTHVIGRAIANELDGLDEICDSLGVQRLSSFLGQSMEEIMDLLGEDIDVPDGEDVNEQWFNAVDGVIFIERLLGTLKSGSDLVGNIDDLLFELEQCRDVLIKAKGIGAQWYLAFDF